MGVLGSLLCILGKMVPEIGAALNSDRYRDVTRSDRVLGKVQLLGGSSTEVWGLVLGLEKTLIP